MKKGLDFSKLFDKEKAVYDGIWVGRCEKFKRPELFLDLVERNKKEKDLENIEKNIKLVIGEDCEMMFEFVKEIESFKNGKYLYVICEVK